MYSTVAVLIAESCDVLYTQALKDKRDAAACRACTSSTPTTCRACILHKHQDQCEKRHKVIKPCGAQGVLLGSSMQQLQRRFSGPLTCHKQSVMTCQLTRQHLASRRARSVPTLPVREQRERWHRERYTACQGLRSRAAAAAAELARPPHTQDPQVIIDALCSPIKAACEPVVSALGGEGSWQYYLVSHFTREVLLVVLAVGVGYWVLRRMAESTAKEAEQQPQGHSQQPGTAGDLLRLMPAALTGGAAPLLVGCVLAVHVLRNTAQIFDGYIAKFNPRLPTDWLDDLVRLVVCSLEPLDAVLTKLSLIGMVLFGSAVVLRWKDIAVSYMVREYVESLDKGSELVASFVNPASNLLNWVVILSAGVWLATALGFNLQPLLAVGGASGIIIGLATQQVLGNFVSGLNIFLARPFVAGEYISLVSQNLTTAAQVNGKVVRVDPMRTLIATEDNTIVTVPNQLVALCVVVNRSRAPHWTVGATSPLLSNPRELRFRMKLPHAALDKFKDLEATLSGTLRSVLPPAKVRPSRVALEVMRFTESGAEVAGKCTLSWRLRSDGTAFTPAATATATAATAISGDGYTNGGNNSGGSLSPTASTDNGVAVVTNMGTVAATAPVTAKNAVAATVVIEAPNAAAAVVESPAAAAAAAAQAKQQMGTQGELMQVALLALNKVVRSYDGVLLTP